MIWDIPHAFRNPYPLLVGQVKSNPPFYGGKNLCYRFHVGMT
jgi:hypothetical protein